MKITFVILALLLATQSSQKKADSSATVSAGIQAKYEENRTAARKAAQAGDLDKAADLYQQNIDMGSNQKPQSQFEIGEASSDLARLRMGQHRLDDAATLFQKSIHAFETDPQPDKDRIALDAQSLGMVYLAKSEFTKAESMFQKSLKLHTEEREKLPWPDGKKAIGVNVERDFFGVASARFQGGDPKGASEYCDKAIAEGEGAHAPKEEMVQVLSQCAYVNRAAGKNADAAELDKKRETLEDSH